MKTMASVARHPIHPMLVPLPIGLWIFSFVCDIFALSTGGTTWEIVASYTMGAGIVGALLAAGPGFVDLFTLPFTLPVCRVKRIGIWHMGINLSIVVLYIVNFLWRRHAASAALGPLMLSLFAILLLVASGWLGGEMVYVHGVAVDRFEHR